MPILMQWKVLKKNFHKWGKILTGKANFEEKKQYVLEINSPLNK
jgi:hypothetical protein